MTFTLRDIAIPEFGETFDEPIIPARIYDGRATEAYQKAGCDWLIVYGDLEHFANLAFLTGHDPRFEEALLCLGPQGRRVLVLGNEGVDQAALAGLPGLETALAQSLSLPGMDRTRAPKLSDILRDLGIRPGASVGLVGWKPVAASEHDEDGPVFLIPHAIVAAIARAAGGIEALSDRTGILLDPMEGIRATNDAHQIAAFEWGAARASAAVQRVVRGARPGMSEYEAMALMRHAGEPMTCRPMFSSTSGSMVGLKSPAPGTIRLGDAVTVAVGYRGGLTARTGMMSETDEAFSARYAAPYFEAQATWCETIGIGVPGGMIEAAIGESLAKAGLRSAFTPGHLGGHDEWLHSITTPGGTGFFRSGALVQCDIIPIGLPAGKALNCEDTLVLADAALRAELQTFHPELFARLQARQRFVRDVLGIAIRDEYLPLTNWPHCLPPCWLAPDRIFARDS
jgi:hypothetical protein